MSLSPSDLGSLIKGNLSAQGAVGANLTIFSNAVAAGIVMSIVGKAFATVDTGLTPGAGVGSGTGITGLDPSAMKSTALGAMSSTGENAPKLMDAIMNAVVTHLGTATLTTADTPVYLGSGVVTPGSIAVVASEMGSNIDSQLASTGAKGVNRTQLANAIAAGVVSNILSAGTGNVTIVGSPTAPVPVPGSGAGVGVIS